MGVLALAAVLVSFFRRRKRGKVPSEQDLGHVQNEKETYAFEDPAPLEKDGQGLDHELGGIGLSHEIEAGDGRPLPELEKDGQGLGHELGGIGLSHEVEAKDRKPLPELDAR